MANDPKDPKPETEPTEQPRSPIGSLWPGSRRQYDEDGEPEEDPDPYINHNT